MLGGAVAAYQSLGVKAYDLTQNFGVRIYSHVHHAVGHHSALRRPEVAFSELKRFIARRRCFDRKCQP
ncbi:hypothetical protein AJ87_15135 [Rhizobium yanglingense]|nr:hypothetical protein AJ87_15135 [Rhizobium yanglingense]